MWGVTWVKISTHSFPHTYKKRNYTVSHNVYFWLGPKPICCKMLLPGTAAVLKCQSVLNQLTDNEVCLREPILTCIECHMRFELVCTGAVENPWSAATQCTYWDKKCNEPSGFCTKSQRIKHTNSGIGGKQLIFCFLTRQKWRIYSL